MVIHSGGQSSKVAVSTTSAQSGLVGLRGNVVVTPDATMFVRRGSNPTALSDGTDQILLANTTYRFYGLKSDDKLAFIMAVGTGNVYITPGA